jgi:hypothetical protein
MLSTIVKTIMTLIFVVTSLTIMTSSAFGEFSSKNGKSEGESGLQAMLFEGGGATVYCLDTAESGSPATWIVENTAKEHVTKGLKLLLKIKTFGSCLGSGSGFTNLTVNSSECELEGNQPGTELSVVGAVVSTCKFSVEVLKTTCEISMEPSSNKALKEISIAYGGLENQNLVLETKLLNVATHVNSTCELAGVKSTTTGQILGFDEELELLAGGPEPEITLGIEGDKSLLLNESRRMVALNVKGGNNAKFLNLYALPDPGNPFALSAKFTTCGTMAYKASEFCSFEVSQPRLSANPTILLIKGISENRASSDIGVSKSAFR